MKALITRVFSDMGDAIAFVRKVDPVRVPGCEELLFESDGYIIAHGHHVVYDPDGLIEASKK